MVRVSVILFRPLFLYRVGEAEMGNRSPATPPLVQSLIIKVTLGPHLGETFNIAKQPFTIGRNADNDVVLPNDSKISRNHVTVSKRENTFVIENLSLRNPIFQDQQERSKIEILPGQKFQIGETELEFNWDDPVAKQVAAAKASVAFKTPDPAKALVISNSPVPNQNQFQIQNANQNNIQPAPRNHNIAPQNVHDLVIPKNYNSTPAVSNNKKNNVVLKPNIDQQVNSNQKKRPRKAKAQNNSFLIILLLVVGTVIFLMPDKDAARKGKKSNLRSSEEIQKALETSKVNVEAYQKEKRIQDDGSIDKQFESSQSYYIRGFRDYRQGQFSRAIQAFQAALSFDPNHTLSRKYLNLSLKKLDELIQFNINQGRRYREKSNYRLCKSAFQQVMTIKKDPNDTVYKEAKQLYDECDTLHKGRY